MVFHQVGDGQNHTHIARFRLDDVRVVFDHRLTCRHRIDHGDVVGLGIFLDNLKRIAKERSNDQIKVFVLDLGHSIFSSSGIVGHVDDGQIKLHPLFLHGLSGNHETLIELKERHGT